MYIIFLWSAKLGWYFLFMHQVYYPKSLYMFWLACIKQGISTLSFKVYLICTFPTNETYLMTKWALLQTIINYDKTLCLF